MNDGAARGQAAQQAQPTWLEEFEVRRGLRRVACFPAAAGKHVLPATIPCLPRFAMKACHPVEVRVDAARGSGRLPQRRSARQQMLHSMVVLGDHLTTQTRLQMEHQRRLEVQGQRTIHLVDDH
jgi:hypothetical protein